MSLFATSYGRSREARSEAHGRVNLIGEHIDYNGGSVLPTPIPQQTVVELAGRDDRTVRVASGSFGGAEAKDAYVLGSEAQRGTWLDYVMGVTRLLAESRFEIAGFDAAVESDLPIGSGLSSSAALLVALLRAIRSRFQIGLDDGGIASLAHRVENEFVGARVGVMDPMVVSLGRPGEALLIDTQTITYRSIRLPASLDLVVIDSGIVHRHADGAYNRRRAECEAARALLGVRYLCDLAPEDLERIVPLSDPLDRRARHAITENRRVHEAVRALESERHADLGALLNESHRSLRDDFEVTTQDVDFLADALRREPGVYGARMTGGGFGGAVLALAASGAGLGAALGAADRYERATGNHPKVIAPAGVFVSSRER